uniref:Uncharacterized protein n=1 Tax=Glossina brevipalpis TaxID=37001 RepID=A0A1A9X5D9_9MUSC
MKSSQKCFEPNLDVLDYCLNHILHEHFLDIKTNNYESIAGIVKALQTRSQRLTAVSTSSTIWLGDTSLDGVAAVATLIGGFGAVLLMAAAFVVVVNVVDEASAKSAAVAAEVVAPTTHKCIRVHVHRTRYAPDNGTGTPYVHLPWQDDDDDDDGGGVCGG